MSTLLIPTVSHYTVEQFARAAKVHRRTFEVWRKRKIAPRTVQRGRSVLIPREAWEDWFERLEADRATTGKPYLRAPLAQTKGGR